MNSTKYMHPVGSNPKNRTFLSTHLLNGSSLFMYKIHTLEDPLAEAILRGEIENDSVVTVRGNKEGLTFKGEPVVVMKEEEATGE